MKAFTKEGWLTPYGLSLGYVHLQCGIRMARDTSGVYCVSIPAHLLPSKHDYEQNARFAFFLTREVSKAREAFKKYVGKLTKHYEPQVNLMVID